MTNFTSLFQPITLAGCTIKNRIVMGSMHTGLEDSVRTLNELKMFYEERAKGGVGLIITGGYAPNRRGWLVPFSGKLTNHFEVLLHKQVTEVVHKHGAKIFLQILHAGRYGYHPFCVSPSGIKSAISKFKPKEMSSRLITSTINDFARCAELAEMAGYDGIEIMGSEGYLINQFIAAKTNRRTDQWGGSFENRIKFPLEIVKAVKTKVSSKFAIMFRLSVLDLVENGSSISDSIILAQRLEEAGVHILNTGIGWHEARIPTIATSVPRGSFAWATAKIKQHITIPIIAVNRINTPELANELIQSGQCQMVSMARPLLADPEFPNKALQGMPDQINTCIACNQGCLDLIFQGKRATCLVNARAGYELKMPFLKTNRIQKIAVVGSGPAGLSFAVTAAQRGHHVTIFEKSDSIGGQFNIAKKIPGKHEFNETIRYFKSQIIKYKIEISLNTEASADFLTRGNWDQIVISTGIHPRNIKIDTSTPEKIVTYLDVLSGRTIVGTKVAIVGAGGIGFDVGLFLSHLDTKSNINNNEALVDDFLNHWGISKNQDDVGALKKPEPQFSKRKIYLLQRSSEKIGRRLGKTTGWIHRLELQNQGVEFKSGVNYERIDEQGFHITINGKKEILDIDHVVICAGQEVNNSLSKELTAQNIPHHLIGGALNASELDAKRAILEGTKLGLTI